MRALKNTIVVAGFVLAALFLGAAVGGTGPYCNGSACIMTSLKLNGRVVATSAPDDAGTPEVYFEYGRKILSSGTGTVVFKNAFSVIPQCFCQDGTAIAACDVPVATISTTQFVVNGTTTDTIMWHCVGDR